MVAIQILRFCNIDDAPYKRNADNMNFKIVRPINVLTDSSGDNIFHCNKILLI